MFGMAVSSGTSDMKDVLKLLLQVLADPKKAKEAAAELERQISALDMMRNEAKAAALQSEEALKKAQQEREAAAMERAEIERIQAANMVKLDQTAALLANREKDIAAREDTLADTAKKVNKDLTDRRAALDKERQELKAYDTDLKAREETFKQKMEADEAQITSRLSAAERHRAQAAQAALKAEELQAKWEGKLKAIEALTSAVSKA